MEVQAQVVRVRCVPLWQQRAQALAEQYKEDPSNAGVKKKLLRSVGWQLGPQRIRLARFLVGYFDAAGLGDSDVAGQLRRYAEGGQN